jgi:hypothetical protein
MCDQERRWVSRKGDGLAFYHRRGYGLDEPRGLELALVVLISDDGFEPELGWAASTADRIQVRTSKEGERVMFQDACTLEILFAVRLANGDIEVDPEWVAADGMHRRERTHGKTASLAY